MFEDSSFACNFSKDLNCKNLHICDNSETRDYSEKRLDETQELIDRSDHLVYLMTHVCSHKLSGIFRTSSKGLECCCRGREEHRHGLAAFEEEKPKKNKRAFDMKSSQRPPPDSSPPALTANSQLHPCACWLNHSSKSSFYRNSHWRCPPHCKEKDPLGYPLFRSWVPWQAYPLWWGGGLASAHSNRKSLKINLHALVILLLLVFARVTESCSARSTPKPRPASPTLRPNVTFQTYACPPAYAAWYCLNGATCFTVKIKDAILYNCECAEGYMGPRCEFKDLDGSYLPKSQRVLQTASIAGGACIAILLVFTILFSLYVFINKDKHKKRVFDDPFDDQRKLRDEDSSPYWPHYVYTISNYLNKAQWNTFYAKKQSSGLLHHPLDIEVTCDSKPIIEVRHTNCADPRCVNHCTASNPDGRAQRLISVIVPK